MTRPHRQAQRQRGRRLSDLTALGGFWSGKTDDSLHCRARKAKCDLGDIDAPTSPPCSRCRRESRECVFAPSRRGGNNARRKKDESEDMPGSSGARLGAPLNELLQSPSTHPYPPVQKPSPVDTLSSLPQTPLRPPESPKRRRLHLNPPLHAADPSSIVVADMQNESDALHILALASGREDNSKRPKAIKPLSEFPLVKLGIVTEEQVVRLSETFFRCHHHLYVSLGRRR
jgi:hypothetical protein